MDGLEVLSLVKGIDPEAVVVVISGHGTISTAVEAVKMGAIDFLEKPLSIDKVLDVISRGLEGKGNGKEERSGDDPHIEMAKGRSSRRQRTIGRSVVAYGVGNHSGVNTGVILLPMPTGTGIVFEHMPDGERIPAFVDYVYSSGFASSLKGKRCTIQTVEHLLAACHMYGLTNLLVKVSEEVPMFDGSARDICSKIEEAGLIVAQKQGVEPLMVQGADRPREPAEREVPLHRARGRAGDRLYAGIPSPHRPAEVRLQGWKGELFDEDRARADLRFHQRLRATRKNRGRLRRPY